MEDWLNDKFENPAKEVFEKIIESKHLTSSDYNKLIRFTAVQSLRTLRFYVKYCSVAQDAFDKSVNEISDKLNTWTKEELIADFKSKPVSNLDEGFPLRAKLTKEEEQSYVHVETLVGRKTWIHEIKSLLVKYQQILHSHKWSIVKMSDNIELPTSDNPVILLNYYGKNKYDFNGGWNSKGSEIIFPLSPQHIFYTKIGMNCSCKNVSDNEKFSNLVRKLVIQNSFMQVYSKNKIKNMFSIKPREVDEVNFQRLKLMKENWHNNQTQGEKNYYAEEEENFVKKHQ